MSRIRQTQDEERDDSNLVITTINSGHWFISYRKRDRELKTTWREIEGWLAEVRIETEISAAWGIWEDGSESIEGSEVVEEVVDIEIGVIERRETGSDIYLESEYLWIQSILIDYHKEDFLKKALYKILTSSLTWFHTLFINWLHLYCCFLLIIEISR